MPAIEVVMMSRVYLVEVRFVRGVGGDSREEGTTQEEFPNVMTAAPQSPLGKLPLALEESFNRSDQGWISRIER